MRESIQALLAQAEDVDLVTMPGWVVQLDPIATAPDRTMLDLNASNGAIQVGTTDGSAPIDWGPAELTQFMTQSGEWGNAPADGIAPNRTVTINMILGGTGSEDDQETARTELTQKVALLQSEGGQLLRQRSGGPAMYADIVDAQLTIPDQWGETGDVEPGVQLVLDVLPDFYGDEITLNTITATGICDTVLAEIANGVPDPSLAYDTVGVAPGHTWATYGTNSLGVISKAGGASGSKSAQAGYGNDLRLASTNTPVDYAVGEVRTISAYVWVPGTWNGGQILIDNDYKSGGAYSNQVNANMALRDQWQRISTTLTAGVSTFNGGIFVRAASAPTSGAAIDISNLMESEGAVLLPYVDGDTADYEWSGTPGDSTTIQQAVIQGDYPSRVRMIVTDASGNNQNSALWGLRSRYYDPATTAALFYEAEALTPVNGAASATLSGASGGHVVTVSSLPGGAWVTFLTSEISSGSLQLTHQGSYRVWARVYSATGTPQLRLQWGVGSLSVPVTNDAVAIPGAAGFYLVDLGPVRLNPPPTGTNEWIGAIQVFSTTGGDSASVDCLYLQPLDDSAGQLLYTPVPPASAVASSAMPTAAANDSGDGGTGAWNDPSDALDVSPFLGAFWTAGGGAGYQGPSEFLNLTGFGFAIPTSATIQGIAVSITKTQSDNNALDSAICLLKAGAVQKSAGQNRANGTAWPQSFAAVGYGGASDLWANTWTPAQINASGFGVGIQAQALQFVNAYVQAAKITVYYTLASGFTVAQDAVVYASNPTEIRSDGMFRTPGSSVYGPVSQVTGDFARLPPSGVENRAAQVFFKPSRGDLDALPDAGLDAFTVQVKYRPCWLSRP